MKIRSYLIKTYLLNVILSIFRIKYELIIIRRFRAYYLPSNPFHLFKTILFLTREVVLEPLNINKTNVYEDYFCMGGVLWLFLTID